MWWNRKKKEDYERYNNLKGQISQLCESNGKLRKDNDALNNILKEQDIEIAREIDLLKREVGDIVFNLKNELNRRLLEFEKQFTADVADKYFSSLQEIFRYNREFSFMERFATGDNKTLTNLHQSIIQPLLDMKRSIADKDKANVIDTNIKSKGEMLLQRRRELWELKLKLGREEKDTRVVDAQIKELDLILGGIK